VYFLKYDTFFNFRLGVAINYITTLSFILSSVATLVNSNYNNNSNSNNNNSNNDGPNESVDGVTLEGARGIATSVWLMQVSYLLTKEMKKSDSHSY